MVFFKKACLSGNKVSVLQPYNEMQFSEMKGKVFTFKG